MRRLRVLGALVAASIAPCQRWTEEVDEAQDIAAVSALGMGARAARHPALEQFGDAAIEAQLRFTPAKALKESVLGVAARPLL
jgi:hypothetical protein